MNTSLKAFLGVAAAILLLAVGYMTGVSRQRPAPVPEIGRYALHTMQEPGSSLLFITDTATGTVKVFSPINKVVASFNFSQPDTKP